MDFGLIALVILSILFIGGCVVGLISLVASCYYFDHK